MVPVVAGPGRPEIGPARFRDVVDALLTTDPRDAGCEGTWQLVHVYAELAAGGADPEATYPGITAHLRSCPPCGQDYEGLLALLAAEEG